MPGNARLGLTNPKHFRRQRIKMTVNPPGAAGGHFDLLKLRFPKRSQSARKVCTLQAFFIFPSFPSPCLGTHLRPKPRLRAVFRHGKPGSFPGKCVPKLGLGNEKKYTPIAALMAYWPARNA